MNEVWKDIQGYEGHYKISNLGRVKSLCRKRNENSIAVIKERILKTTPNSIGYPRVVLSLNGEYISYRVHRLVAIAFIPNPENKPQVNHINGIKADNRLENLEWCSNGENQIHAYSIGLQKSMKGDKHWNSILTESQVIDIIKRLKKGESNISIAKAYNITQKSISDIKQNKKWKHLKKY